MIENMLDEEPSENTRAEIVLPYAFRGLLIHLLNPQLKDIEEPEDNHSLMEAIVKSLWLLVNYCNEQQ